MKRSFFVGRESGSCVVPLGPVAVRELNGAKIVARPADGRPLLLTCRGVG